MIVEGNYVNLYSVAPDITIFTTSDKPGSLIDDNDTDYSSDKYLKHETTTVTKSM